MERFRIKFLSSLCQRLAAQCWVEYMMVTEIQSFSEYTHLSEKRQSLSCFRLCQMEHMIVGIILDI